MACFKCLKRRDVQYMHCVMHKCIMGKAGGNEIHVKYVEKHVNFTKLGEICKSRVGKEKFSEIEGNELKQGNKGEKLLKIWGE